MSGFITKRVYDEPVYNYTHYAAEIRGKLINDVAEMESMIDEYICKHFCPSKAKREELKEVVIATKHLTFQAKSEILKTLLVKNNHATNKEANKIYNTLLEEIASKRNIIAHCTIDISRTSIEAFEKDKQTIYFYKYDKVKKTIPFNKKDARELGELILSAKNFFAKILRQKK